MKRLLIPLLLIVLSSLLFIGGIVYAAPFTNGSFEVGPDPGGSFINLASGSTAITGWQVLPSDIDYVGGYWEAQHGARSLDLNGWAPGGIQQSFDTVMGNQYEVTFWLAGNPDGGPVIKTLNVAATGNPDQDYTFDISDYNRRSMGWTQHTYSFMAHGSIVTLSFTSKTINVGGLSAYGPALDNVSVVGFGPPIPRVPEPATMLLLGSGLIGLWGFRKKVRK